MDACFCFAIGIATLASIALPLLFWGGLAWFTVKALQADWMSGPPPTDRTIVPPMNDLIRLLEEAQRFQAQNPHMALPSHLPGQIQSKMFQFDQQMMHLDRLNRERSELFKADVIGQCGALGIDPPSF